MSVTLNLESTLSAVSSIARETGREACDIHIIAVSKTFDAGAIRPVLEAGHREFGENRVQEAARKWPDLRLDFTDVVLHLIGPLQSNKTKDAVALFDAIHTVDRLKIAHSIAQEMQRQSRRLQLFVQVNTGEEDQKAGLTPAEVQPFIEMCRTQLKLDISGLMCIPPVHEEPAVHFALLAKLANKNGLQKLSMGMSADFQTAIQFGATHIRVGSAIFGARP